MAPEEKLTVIKATQKDNNQKLLRSMKLPAISILFGFLYIFLLENVLDISNKWFVIPGMVFKVHVTHLTTLKVKYKDETSEIYYNGNWTSVRPHNISLSNDSIYLDVVSLFLGLEYFENFRPVE